MLVLNLIINTYLKYKSTKEEKRKDGQQSAHLAAIILH